MAVLDTMKNTFSNRNIFNFTAISLPKVLSQFVCCTLQSLVSHSHIVNVVPVDFNTDMLNNTNNNQQNILNH